MVGLSGIKGKHPSGSQLMRTLQLIFVFSMSTLPCMSKMKSIESCMKKLHLAVKLHFGPFFFFFFLSLFSQINSRTK